MLNSFSVRLLLAVLLGLMAAGPARARVLRVGPDRPLAAPSAAAAIAGDGDTILIDAGRYADCAVWRASHLQIAAIGGEVVLRGRICQGKGIFVTVGHDIVIRGLTFEGARSVDHNGAGIRAEGASLTLEQCQFLDNENGILAAPARGSAIRVRDSLFRGNGACDGPCAHGMYVNRIALLDIAHSRFIDQHVGHNIKSRALRTVLVDNTIEDGPDGTSSYLVDLPNGGDLLMRGNVLEKGPKSQNPPVAITIGEEDVTNPTHRIELRDNRLRNDQVQPTIFLRNVTNVPALLTGNTFAGPVVALDGPGVIRR